MPEASPAPFLVLGLPRSRTAWLSRFLTYRDWLCGHDEIRHLRSMADIDAWLSMPNTGSAETAAAPWWRLALKKRPDLKLVVVRRDPVEVSESVLRCGLTNDREATLKVMRRLDHKLAQIVRRVPGVLSVRYEDLASESTCAQVFEHCLPYDHDPAWWRSQADVRVEINVPLFLRYYRAHEPQLTTLTAIAKQHSLADLTAQPGRPSTELTIAVEPFESFYEDGQALFRQHMAQVGERPDDFSTKNIPLMRQLADIGCIQVVTARSNGRMFGYLMTVLSPSLESPRVKSAVQTTFFASPDYPGLGLKIQRASLEHLRARGIDEVVYRAGPRGSGPKMPALYRRLGAEPHGELYHLALERN